MKIFIRSSKQTSKCMALLLLYMGSITTMSTTQAATNLVLRNPKFTTDPKIATTPPGWTFSNPALVTWSTTGGYDNSGAIKLSDPGPNVSAVAESEQVAVKAGAQIDVSAQVKLQNNTDPATVMLAIKFYAGTTALPITTSMGAVGNNDQWLLTKLSVIAPAGATKASVVLFTANAAPATAYFDNITFTTPDIQDKGDQITRSLVSAAAFDGDVLYVGATGFPAKFAAYNVSNGERRFEVELPKTEEILSVAVATDRTVYIGTASGRLYQHGYGSTTVKLVGTSISEAIWTLKPGSNGSMYGGGSKDAAAFHFTPSDSKMYPIPGPVSTAKNVRSLAVDKIGEKIYWGLGTSAASYQTDLSGNNPKDLLSGVAKGTNWDYTYYTDYVGGKVFARITGSLLNQTLVLDPSTPTAKPPEPISLYTTQAPSSRSACNV
ncbi:hypothetical protein F2P44_30165 [Massilia sp. CCM 8695]|uniref:Uncharacterized protein n=1 Tax=Massilia frigida TaxID=2609281 RepID=A0ABX0NK47_9BURK|nr:hypothetical protein [Massilia frigida]NHZ83500.1 hypothetical protein [Massilia frigida]